MAGREVLEEIKALLSQHKREVAGETANNMHRFKQEIVMGITQQTKGMLETHQLQSTEALSGNGQRAEEKPAPHACVHILKKEVQELKVLALKFSEELARARREPAVRPKQRRNGSSLQAAFKRQKKIRVMMAQTAALETTLQKQLACARCESCGNAVPVRPVRIGGK